MFAALREAEEDIEEMLSARAKGAAGGGLELEVNGGLNGLGWTQEFTGVLNRQSDFKNKKYCKWRSFSISPAG